MGAQRGVELAEARRQVGRGVLGGREPRQEPSVGFGVGSGGVGRNAGHGAAGEARGLGERGREAVDVVARQAVAGQQREVDGGLGVERGAGEAQHERQPGGGDGGTSGARSAQARQAVGGQGGLEWGVSAGA